MLQEIITYGIVAIAILIVGYRIYNRIWGRAKTSSKCNGCSGCGESKPKTNTMNQECNSVDKK